ncbi:heterokaryon incompatibility protein-domain-containing protein [Stachybotrys elegans]|uniref:Heterokaryon incompatibility protein-domain-containing protein n=1 Tax=Stachybotrys elegans TaxID=80388 RepID=A0A8K0SJF4_9HYPO|nr:heterokaryon incompatibility protein-domain-containing protein [Stachybotrys elegans]
MPRPMARRRAATGRKGRTPPPESREDHQISKGQRKERPTPSQETQNQEPSTSSQPMAPSSKPFIPSIPTGDLCSFCSKLDLSKLATLPNNRYQFHIIADVGDWYYQTQETTCPLCLILRMQKLDLSTELESRDDEVLCAADFFHLTPLAFLPHARTPGADPFCLLRIDQRFLRSLKDPGHTDALQWFRRRAQGLAVISFPGSSHSLLHFRGAPAFFDVSVAHRWLRYCEQHHGDDCSVGGRKLDFLVLIDCESQQIVHCDLKNVEYVALSYVWGSSGDSATKKARRKSRPRKLPQPVALDKLPATIHDAILVTTSLGFRYLWVDQLCIDQQDAKTKHKEIMRMGDIYKGAHVTIIAAAGEYSEYGLPGVRSSRNQQPVARLGDAKITLTQCDPHVSILGSKWSTRRWTFQEGRLSRRRLVFTDQQVYFECNTMNCWENVDVNLDNWHLGDIRKNFRSGVMSATMLGSPEYGIQALKDPYVLYLDAINNYSSRDITFEEDTLRAFQGIMDNFSQQPEVSMAQICGLPFPRLVCQHTHKSGATDTCLQKMNDWFAQSLCWGYSGLPGDSPRTSFPSWTWAGWRGQVYYYTRQIVVDDGQPWRAVSIAFLSDKNDPMEVTLADLQLPSLIPRVLRLSVFLVPPSTFKKRGADLVAGKSMNISCYMESYVRRAVEEYTMGEGGWRVVYVNNHKGDCHCLVLKPADNGYFTRLGRLSFLPLYEKDFREELLGYDWEPVTFDII